MTRTAQSRWMKAGREKQETMNTLRKTKSETLERRKPRFRFFWSMPDASLNMLGGRVDADDCGDARAIVKRQLKIGNHGRLPAGMHFERVDNK